MENQVVSPPRRYYEPWSLAKSGLGHVKTILPRYPILISDGADYFLIYLPHCSSDRTTLPDTRSEESFCAVMIVLVLF
ncbi:MAG: hypothetical protein AAGF96_21100 [Bacteroidota bacterium]